MYENRVFETIRQGILDKIETLITDEGTFISDMVSPIALEIDSCYREFSKILDTAFLKKLSGQLLDLKSSEYGINRKNGTFATGEILFTGTDGTIIPKGTLVSTISGLLFETLEETSILNLTSKANIKALEIGSQHNLLSGLVCNIPVSISGIISARNENPTRGGTNIESDEDLLKRVLLFLQTPATSGNVHHYKLWATSVSGVSDSRIFPLWNGNGTVKIQPITNEKRAPSSEIISLVLQHINKNKPIGADVSVISPREVFIDILADISFNSSTNLDVIKAKYTQILGEYIKSSVYKINVVDLYKCLSFFYEIEGVLAVNSFKINGNSQNISILETDIQVLGNITLTGGV